MRVGVRRWLIYSEAAGMDGWGDGAARMCVEAEGYQ